MPMCGPVAPLVREKSPTPPDRYDRGPDHDQVGHGQGQTSHSGPANPVISDYSVTGP